MANRTTSDAVALIVEVDTTIVLDSFIEAANALVTELLAATYDDTRLELIERWLSAHFYAIRDMRRSSEGAGSVNESFQYRVGLFLANTMYGQQAMMLDTAGILAAFSKKMEQGGKRTVGVSWLGKKCTTEESEN